MNVDQVERLHEFQERHRDVIITRPDFAQGQVRGQWSATRLGKYLASDPELRCFLDALDECQLPDVMVSES